LIRLHPLQRPLHVRYKGLSVRDCLGTLTQIRRGQAMQLKLHIGEQILIPSGQNTLAALETVRHLIGINRFQGARKENG